MSKFDYFAKFKGKIRKIMKFSETLKDLMLDNNLSIKELVDASKINISTIYFYLKHNSLPDVQTAIKLSEYFNCSINFLLGLSDDKEIKIVKTNTRFIDNYEFLLKEFKTNNYNVSNNLNINRNSIYNWKKGKTPKMIILVEIAKYFNTSVDFLLGRTKDYVL